MHIRVVVHWVPRPTDSADHSIGRRTSTRLAADYAFAMSGTVGAHAFSRKLGKSVP